MQPLLIPFLNFVSLSKLDVFSGIIFCDKQKGILSIAFSVIERKKGCAELLITDHSFTRRKKVHTIWQGTSYIQARNYSHLNMLFSAQHNVLDQ